jgi:hypothetical protein
MTGKTPHERIACNEARERCAAVEDEIARITYEYGLACEADAGFDGGEWSGPANAKAEHEAVVKVLAEHGISEDEWAAYENELEAQDEIRCESRTDSQRGGGR